MFEAVSQAAEARAKGFWPLWRVIKTLASHIKPFLRKTQSGDDLLFARHHARKDDAIARAL